MASSFFPPLNVAIVCQWSSIGRLKAEKVKEVLTRRGVHVHLKDPEGGGSFHWDRHDVARAKRVATNALLDADVALVFATQGFAAKMATSLSNNGRSFTAPDTLRLARRFRKASVMTHLDELVEYDKARSHIKNERRITHNRHSVKTLHKRCYM